MVRVVSVVDGEFGRISRFYFEVSVFSEVVWFVYSRH